MTTLETIYARRAVRDYTGEQVSEATIRELIDAAIQAPSAINSQPWAFVVIQDKALMDEISNRAIELMRFQNIPSDLRTMIEKPGWSIFYNASNLIIICSKPEGSHPDWDCCLAAENLMLAARSKGLGTCLIGFAWEALSMPDIKRRFDIPKGYHAVTPIILGHPTAFPETHGRKPAEMLSWKAPAKR